jgi:hypothetical protein
VLWQHSMATHIIEHVLVTRQDRKRQLDGAPKSSQQQQPQPSAAAARWSNTGGPTSMPKRVDVSHGSGAAAAAGSAWAQPQRGAAGAVDDPIEVDDDEGTRLEPLFP